MRKMGLVILMFGFWLPGFSIDKKELEQRYSKGKYLVVLREGLFLAVCPFGPNSIAGHSERPYFLDKVTEAGSDISDQGRLARITAADQHNRCVPASEPIQKREVLRSLGASSDGKWLRLRLESITPHSVTGPFAPFGIVMFSMDGGFDKAKGLADQWLQPFDTQEEAAKFGNTASGAFVKEVKKGMTPAEVESVMGLPVSKADLGEKVLYKYRDITVEFYDGEVTDVR